MPPRLTRCPELSRLPPSPTPLRNVNFRRTTPGSAPPMLFYNGSQPQRTLFDPTHPFASLPLKTRANTAPRFVSPALTVRAFPKAFLTKPQPPFPSPPYTTTPYPERRKAGAKKVDMSFVTIAYERQIVLSDVVRTRVKRRVKEAVRLVVTRGARTEATVVKGKEEKHVAFNEGDARADRWIIPGYADWTYVFQITNELHAMSQAEMVGLVRDALDNLMKQADVTVKKWEGMVRKDKKSNPRTPTRRDQDEGSK